MLSPSIEYLDVKRKVYKDSIEYPNLRHAIQSYQRTQGCQAIQVLRSMQNRPESQNAL